MTWRDVPMPPQIARLERDRRGYPIPYIAQRYPLLVPPPVDPVLGMVACEDTSGPCQPLLGFMSEERQRRCFLKFRCQVCERSVARGARWLAGGVADMPLATFAFREPYVCGSCLRYAVQVCPGLVTGARSGGLRIVRVRSVELLAECVAPTVFDPNRIVRLPMGARVRATCVFYLLAQVTDGDVMTTDEFLDGDYMTSSLTIRVSADVR